MSIALLVCVAARKLAVGRPTNREACCLGEAAEVQELAHSVCKGRGRGGREGCLGERAEEVVLRAAQYSEPLAFGIVCRAASETMFACRLFGLPVALQVRVGESAARA